MGVLSYFLTTSAGSVNVRKSHVGDAFAEELIRLAAEEFSSDLIPGWQSTRQEISP